MILTSSQLQEVIATCEFDQWMGLKVQTLNETSLTLLMPFRQEIIGTPKFNSLHGGVLASLIDAAGCYLLIALLAERVSTVNLVVDYLRPAQGEMLAVARVVKIGNRICNMNVDVIRKDGKVVATGRLTVLPLKVPLGEEERLVSHQTT